MSVFCGVVLAVLLLLLIKTLMNEVNLIPIFCALSVLALGSVWIVFLKHLPTFDTRFIVMPFHFVIAGLLALAVHVDFYNNRGVESIPLFAVTMILTLFCPFKGYGLWICSAFYTSLFAISYWGEYRWPTVVGWHFIAILVIAVFRIVYHRWSSARVDMIINCYSAPGQSGLLDRQKL